MRGRSPTSRRSERHGPATRLGPAHTASGSGHCAQGTGAGHPTAVRAMCTGDNALRQRPYTMREMSRRSADPGIRSRFVGQDAGVAIGEHARARPDRGCLVERRRHRRRRTVRQQRRRAWNFDSPMPVVGHVVLLSTGRPLRRRATIAPVPCPLPWSFPGGERFGEFRVRGLTVSACDAEQIHGYGARMFHVAIIEPTPVTGSGAAHPCVNSILTADTVLYRSGGSRFRTNVKRMTTKSRASTKGLHRMSWPAGSGERKPPWQIESGRMTVRSSSGSGAT